MDSTITNRYSYAFAPADSSTTDDAEDLLVVDKKHFLRDAVSAPSPTHHGLMQRAQQFEASRVLLGGATIERIASVHALRVSSRTEADAEWQELTTVLSRSNLRLGTCVALRQSLFPTSSLSLIVVQPHATLMCTPNRRSAALEVTSRSSPLCSCNSRRRSNGTAISCFCRVRM